MPRNSRHDCGKITAMSKIRAKANGQQSAGHRQSCQSLPSFSLDTADFRAAERCDVWSDINSPNFHMRSVDNEKFNIDAKFSAWTADDLTLIDTTFNPTAGSRCAVSLNINGSEMVALRYCSHGGMSGTIADDTVGLDGAHVCLVDQQRDFHGVTAGLRQMSIYVPYDLIGYDPSRDPAARSFAINTPVGRVLQGVMTCAFDSISNLTGPEAHAVSAGLEGAIRGLLNTDRDDEQTRSDFEKTRNAAMRIFILENINNPDLSVADVCSAFGASRATAFRAFKPAGGIQRYIMNRRLDRAYRMLSLSPELRGQVTRVAFECGFRDTSLFFRAFRDRFGMPPGEVLGQHFAGRAGAGEDVSADVDSLQDQQIFIDRLFE